MESFTQHGRPGTFALLASVPAMTSRSVPAMTPRVDASYNLYSNPEAVVIGEESDGYDDVLDTSPVPTPFAKRSKPNLKLVSSQKNPLSSFKPSIDFSTFDINSWFPGRNGARNLHVPSQKERDTLLFRDIQQTHEGKRIQHNIVELIQKNIKTLLVDWMTQVGFTTMPEGIAKDFVDAMNHVNNGDPIHTLAHASDHALVGLMVDKLHALLKQHASEEIQVQITEDVLRYGGAAASLHDFGKTARDVHAAINCGIKFDLKNNPYHREIMNLIKKHPAKGAQLLRQRVKDLQKLMELGLQEVDPEHVRVLELAQDIALNHHEQFSGGGYHGKRGDDIPLVARTTTVVDVFGALMERNRGYRTAEQSAELALHIMETDPRQQGSFDPRILSVFRTHIETIVDIRNDAVKNLDRQLHAFVTEMALEDLNLMTEDPVNIFMIKNSVIAQIMRKAGVYELQQ